MAMCPLCNSLKVFEMYCPKCTSRLDDSGKVSDFLDPYGHYDDEETVKMGDGYPNTAKNQICPHLMVCNNCGYDVVKFVQEE
ncbi:hypothetical protein [Domibacillus mangrovi]|uniref:Uncharacterized protein n=1 Tax=Domibacillus mangrovi TaxID=1714354 RepID=A0A1Q5P3V2_9BACI|nr:hypothetical protein [Domibacillus mangrovi]OKL36929.1 hypothetical protein BLL40_09470 [Domibacillus mangrovi]